MKLPAVQDVDTRMRNGTISSRLASTATRTMGSRYGPRLREMGVEVIGSAPLLADLEQPVGDEVDEHRPPDKQDAHRCTEVGTVRSVQLLVDDAGYGHVRWSSEKKRCDVEPERHDEHEHAAADHRREHLGPGDGAEREE